MDGHFQHNVVNGLEQEHVTQSGVTCFGPAGSSALAVGKRNGIKALLFCTPV